MQGKEVDGIFDRLETPGLLLETVPDGVVIAAGDGTVLTVNEAFCRLTGYSQEDVPAGPVLDLFLINDAGSDGAAITRALQQGERQHFETEVVCADEARIPVMVYATPLKDRSGVVIGLVAVIRDLTHSRSMQEAWRESEERFQAFARTSPDMIHLNDERGRIIYVNPVTEELLGYPARELLGLSAAELIHPDDREGIARDMALVVNRKNIPPREIRLIKRDGNILHVEALGFLVNVQHRQYVGAILRDITDRQRLNARLQQTQKMEAIGRLSGGIAHDFNNLLTTIIGYSELMLLDYPEDHPMHPNLEAIHEAAGRAGQLTQQLLAFSRKQMLEMKVISLNSVIQAMSSMLERLLGEDIEFVLYLQDSQGNIRADVGSIEQIIMNLTLNARDAMPRGGRLIYETALVQIDEEVASLHAGMEPGSYVLLAVTDTGHGMTSEVLERIFEPFFTTKERGKGTGFGLSTVYGVVKQHHGYIFAYSEPDKGTTFKIYFPGVQDPCDKTERPRNFRSMPTGTETIMVVDDEQSIRRFIVDTMKPLGYTVLEAASGEDALDKYAEMIASVDLLLTDVVMPGMNGMELAAKLHRCRSAMKVICMSGYTENVIADEGILRPNINFISKPLTPIRLAVKVRSVLDSDKGSDT